MEYQRNSTVMERRLIREQRLQQYNEMKPVLKQILGSTVRIAGKMMKLLFKTAFRIPGLAKRAADAAHRRDEAIAGRKGS